jgi:hypothetical protein
LLLLDCFVIERPLCKEMQGMLGVDNTLCIDYACNAPDEDHMNWWCPDGTFSTSYDDATRMDYPATPMGVPGFDDYVADWNFYIDCILWTECLTGDHPNACDAFHKCYPDLSTSVLTYPCPRYILTGNACCGPKSIFFSSNRLYV